MTIANNHNETKKQVTPCLSLVTDILRDDLLAMYLYGSSILGGLQKYSDIDLFVISNRPTTRKEKAHLASNMLKISGIYAVSVDLKPIELTIVVKSDINPWHYPPKFDFLYGDWMRKDFESGNIEPWPTKELPNLALVITQLLLSNKILFGPNPDTLLDPVPYKDFMLATTREIDSLLGDIEWDTRNVLLTLGRIWSTLETDTIRSKADAATCAIDRLPVEYKNVMKRARLICLGEEREYWEDMKALLKPCADFMVVQIKKQMTVTELSDYSYKSIKLAGQ